MKLALLSFLGSVFVGAVNTAVWCVPGECRVDSNCIDSIHSVSGKCCGGVCTRAGDRQRFVGEQCAPRDLSHADNYERCFADCGSGLFCNTVDERCHAKHGPGCPCLADRECLSNMCRGSHVCSGENLPFGEACELNNECSSNYCSEQTKKCSALAIGEACNSFGGVPCVPDAVCRRNTTAFSTYCLSPCAAGAADCCYDGSSVCAKTPANLVCDSGNYSCYVNTPPGLGEACPLGLCSNSTTMVCATECNGGGCGTVRVCQLRNQLAVGTPCEVTSQCVVGALCQYNFANFTYECALLPTNAPSGAPTSAPTAALNSVPLGQPCGDPENFNLCMAPGNMCEANETGTFVCKQSGTTPIGAFCSISSVSLSVRAIDECVKGSRCTKNATNFGAGSFACRTPIPIGQRCYSTSASQIFNTPMCENGFDNCAMTGRNCYSCDYNDVSGNPCCTCVAPRTVADGKNCSAHSQCQKATSLCHPNNYTCVNIQGIDCITPSNCLDSSFDCNCDRKCYLLNAPTPAQISHAPTASTRAPSPYTPRCDAQQKAWNALPASSSFYFTSFPRLSYATFHEQFLPQALVLTEANQAILIAYICCETCYWNDRFNSHIYASYQVDCGAKKLIKLEDTCDDLRAPWALANCWGALSAAPSLDMGFALVATLLVVFF